MLTLHLSRYGRLLAGLGMALLVAPSHANVTVASTRVVFPGDSKEITLRLSNIGDSPALIEAWVDSGDLHSTPDTAVAPFLITPPLFRMDAHKEQSLRILATPFAFASDRETLFWLNVLEIPPKPTGASAPGNYVQFSVRSRLKLFYRPKQLHGDSSTAPAKLVWTRAGSGAGSVKAALEVSNPTPYYITVIKLSVAAAGRTYVGDTEMVAPFGKLQLAVDGLAQWPAGPVQIDFETVNDYGAAAPYKAEIGP